MAVGALGGGIPSDLTDDVWDYGSTDGEIFWVIREGIDSSADMLPYEKTLSEKEMAPETRKSFIAEFAAR